MSAEKRWRLSLAFEVPLPPADCSPNGYKHWRRVSKAKREYRQAVQLAALWKSPVCDAPERVRVSLVFGIKGARNAGLYAPRDANNAVAAFKAGFDGIVDAGLAIDDSARHMALGSVEITSEDGPWVRVIIEEVAV